MEENDEAEVPVTDPEEESEGVGAPVALPVAFPDALTLPVINKENEARGDGEVVGEKRGVSVVLPVPEGDTELVLLPN